ncbi:membrane protein insertion efficiency factor YidD [Sideroxyarcus emersonii]|uniref:membrane protein insertion efficiency factor YidD n=1 Tax=Sideroxyarcus emersonii TaxID=2764705 RepID=UPI001F41B575|nr:membrane protein insertion efficiency factor YidD [Sideroxyarcus emersonii]
MKSILLLMVRGYQLMIRPVLPPSCRFSPSCSQYSHEAISKYGALKGLWLTIKRLIRCNPWNPGGYDPVP